MHIDLLAQILAVAVDHGHLESNPAVGKRRRMKISKPRPVHLDSAEQIALLLEAAGQLDRGEAVIDVTDRRGRSWTQRHPAYTAGRRAALATLPLLREILTEHKAASAKTGAHDPVFVTATGTPRSRHNLRQDVVDTSVAHAHRLAEERGLQPLPLGITPHKLRHTFASILVAIGKDPTYVMQQLRHTDPAFTLRV
jgi:integrase